MFACCAVDESIELGLVPRLKPLRRFIPENTCYTLINTDINT